MNTELINQIERAFYEGFSDSSFRKHGKGYVGPLEIVENENHYIVTKVIVGFESAEITANVRKSILKVFVNDEKEKPANVVSIKLDADYINAFKISSNTIGKRNDFVIQIFFETWRIAQLCPGILFTYIMKDSPYRSRIKELTIRPFFHVSVYVM